MPNARLDVVDDPELRLRRLLEHTDRRQSPGTGPSTDPSRPSFDFGVRETHALVPPTQLLDRLHQFLPQMEAANADLLQRAELHPESVDIEHLDASAPEGAYIEMNLGLGVFDIRRPAPDHSDADSADSSVRRATDSDGSSDASDSVADGIDSDSDSDSGSDVEDDPYSTLIGSLLSPTASTQRPMRPLPKRTHPLIQVLGESAPPDDPVHENSSPS